MSGADPPVRPAVLRKRTDYRRHERRRCMRKLPQTLGSLRCVQARHTDTFSDINVPLFPHSAHSFNTGPQHPGGPMPVAVATW